MICFLLFSANCGQEKDTSIASKVAINPGNVFNGRLRNQKVEVVFRLKMGYFTKIMRPFLAMLLVVSAAVLDTHAVPRNLKDDYQPIITRNPFDLKPIQEVKVEPPVVKPPEPQKKQEVYLTGIASVGYPTFPKKAYLVVRESGTNLYYSLREEEKKDTVKLIKINDEVKPPTVRIEHNGSEMLLSFKTHSMPSAAGVPPGRPGAAPGVPGMPQPLPGGSPQPINNSANFQPGGPSTPPPNYNGPTINGMVPGATHIPSRVNRAVPDANYAPAPNPAMNLSPGVVGGAPVGSAPPGANYGDPAGNNIDVAEQYLRLKLEETRQRQKGIPTPPIPQLE